MKKIITLCVFAFALVLGTQTMNGQTMVEINQAAFTKTQELKKIIKFDAETEEEVYLVYQAYESKMYNVNQSIANGDVISDEDKQMALFDGEPTYPNASYLVISVYNKLVRDEAWFEWNSQTKSFEKKIF